MNVLKRMILVVDDEPDHIFTIKQLLEHGGKYEVIGAKDATECLELLDNQLNPDLILLDVMMPRTSGWDLFARLKEKPEWRGIPIVFLTALSDDVSKGFGSVTADDYIEKPYEPDDLRRRIDKILDGK